MPKCHCYLSRPTRGYPRRNYASIANSSSHSNSISSHSTNNVKWPYVKHLTFAVTLSFSHTAEKLGEVCCSCSCCWEVGDENLAAARL